MKVLAVHPGPLLYTKIYLRLEPLGLELVTAAARRAGHDVRLIDLQVETHRDLFAIVDRWRPDAVVFSFNYLANLPEIVDLAKSIRTRLRHSLILVGGHSASFTAREILEHGAGAVDCVLRGEGEAGIVSLLAAWEDDRTAIGTVAGVVTAECEGPTPGFVHSLDGLWPARDLLRHRRKYFIGEMDPCASIEFTRGCPWDCSFCSAWTFYGRSYRTRSPEDIVAELATIREPGIFIVDDVAFIQSRQGFEIGEAIARRGINKQYYLETRADVLLRNQDVFRFWKDLGLRYMFLGMEAIDEEGLAKYRKRVNLDQTFEALEVARSLGIRVAINIIADPDWDRQRFRTVREWCLEVPEIVNVSVNTPYPGTETWLTEARRLAWRDYRLFDIQHAVLPTRLPLAEFYEELIGIQRVLARKHLGWALLADTGLLAARLLARGQTNFVKMLWKFNSVYDAERMLADHRQTVDYRIALPPPAKAAVDPKSLFVHTPRGRLRGVLDKDTQHFIDQTAIRKTEAELEVGTSIAR
jgi:hopanoid C-3 methylase HpnR